MFGRATRHFALLFGLVACKGAPPPSPATTSAPTTTSAPLASTTPAAAASSDVAAIANHPNLAGFRASNYGIRPFPGADYWQHVGQTMASALTNGTPGGIWILGTLHERGCRLTFPAAAATSDPLIAFSGEDLNETTLQAFDRAGVKVWLQVEPGFADVDALIDLVMSRYAHHPSVIGFGVDVEWHQSTDPDRGAPVTDDIAKRWLAKIRHYDPTDTLMLKHWLPQMMPATVRDGLFFLDDSQGFASRDAWLQEFKVWGQHFGQAPVGFQIGYPADKAWWSQHPNPTAELSRLLAADIPNTRGVFWVDFTVRQVFPPQ